MGKDKGFSLTEVMIVIVILAIMITAASIKYTNTFDQVAEREASTKLDMIIAADEIYKMNTGVYYLTPDSAGAASVSTTTGINGTLNTLLPSTDSRNWDYVVQDATPDACAFAVRWKNGASVPTECRKLCTHTTAVEKDCPTF